MMATPESLRSFLNTPLTIGGRTVSGRLMLAPLSKAGNVAFRELVAEFGGFGLLFSEMAGCRSIPMGNGHLTSGFMWRPEELPFLSCQIYGDDPEEMGRAAARVEEEGFFGVDLNFGCSVQTVCKHHCGAALLKEPLLAEAIVRAVRRAVSIPVSVKYRTGWKDDPDFAVDMARRFEGAGADALTFHPRVAPDRRTRPPRWEYIGRVKAAVSVPVIGNGNIFDITDCERMVRATGCDGVAIGRLALCRPWIFAQWTDGFDPDSGIFGRTALRLIHLLKTHFAPAVALRRFYKFAPYFSANFKFGQTFFSRVHQAKSLESLETTVREFFSAPHESTDRPNLAWLR